MFLPKDVVYTTTAKIPFASFKEINLYLIPLKRAGRKEITINGYGDILVRTLIHLRNSKKKFFAAEVDFDSVDYLQDTFWIDAPKYNHNRRTTFFAFLKFHENTIGKHYPSPRNSTMRVNKDWLSDKEAIRLWNACETPLEKAVIHSELSLCMRRDEARLLRVDSVSKDPLTEEGVIDVLGKFSKWRTLAFLSDTEQIFNDWLKVREQLVQGVSDPDELFLYRIGKYAIKVKHYEKTAWDNIVHHVAIKAGIDRPVSNHTLRRTGARMWYRAGATIHEIMLLLGHDNEATTWDYLGLALEDLKKGSVKFDRWFTAKLEKALKEDEWTGRDLNSRPLPCQGSDLPTDLPAH
jgi:Site-specific recombinase XerD